MAAPKFVLLGHVCIDHNVSEHATYKGWGSSVFYMATYLKNVLGLEPIVVASYGPDMLAYAPEVTLVPDKPPAAVTLIYENDSRTGKRIQHCRNIGEATPPVLDETVKEIVHGADVLMIAPLLDNYGPAYIRELLGQAQPAAVKVLCPQGYFRHVADDGRVTFQDFAALDEIIPLFDLVFYSEEDHPRAFELGRFWSKNSAVKIIVTRSADGASIITRNGSTHIPTIAIPPEEIIDSVGCGDVFAASCAYEYVASRDIVGAVQVGHDAAGRKLRATPVD